MRNVEQTAKDALQAKRSAWEYGNFRYDHRYGRLLQLVAPKVKRQTPLVNAGYGIRVDLVLSRIQAFVEFAQIHQEPCNLLILGAGLDVVGQWTLQYSNIHVIEVDTVDVCDLKSSSLSENEDWTWTTDPSGVRRALTEIGSTYQLVGGNLRDETTLKTLVTCMDVSIPTMVLSELVLTYLGADACRRIFKWSVNEIFRHNALSCFFLYESIGANEKPRSVLDGYKWHYSQKFESKLQQGLAPSESADTLLFHPIGASPTEMESILSQEGFSHIHGVTTWDAVRCQARNKPLVITEPFDEHAALILHLQSYGVCCAFSRRSSSLFRSVMGPWSRDLPTERRETKDGFAYFVGEVDVEHEDEIRDIFQSIYTPLYKEYPVIRKMVNGVLRKDFAKSRDGRRTAVARWYREAGGYYLVAIDPCKNNASRKVLGGIGVRKMRSRGASRQDEPVFEILRLFVRQEQQGSGVASSLLQSAVSYLQYLHKNRDICLEATTVDVLSSAKRFYESKGFSLKSHQALHGLRYNTYQKIYD